MKASLSSRGVMDGDGSRKKKSTSKQVEFQEDSSFLENLKTEWSLFWHSLLGEDEPTVEETDSLLVDKLEALDAKEVKAIIRALSQEKKIINQDLENTRFQMDENHLKIENMMLVGGDFESVEQENHNLAEKGRELALRLAKIDQRLKIARRVDREKQKSLELQS